MQNSQAFFLRHDHGKWTVRPHPDAFFASILQCRQHTGQSPRFDEIKPLGQIVFGMNREIRIGEEPLDPGYGELELFWFATKHTRDHLIHFEGALVNDLMPVHGAD